MKQQAQRQLGEKSNSAAPRKEGNVQKVNGLVEPFVLYVFFFNACSRLYNCKLFHLDPIEYDTS